MKRKYTVTEKIIILLLEFGVMLGFLMVIGGVGSIDFADEMGEVLTRAEEIRAYGTSVLGLVVAGVCVFILDRTGVMSDM